MPIQSLPEGAGTGKIKKRIRDLERLLRKPGLAATKKAETERALAVLRRDLTGAADRNKKRTIAQKYHMVRFFEKKKALRKLRKAGSGDAELAQYHYVVEFPKDEKYVALFAEGSVGHTHPFMAEVRRRMKAGELAAGAEGRSSAIAEGRAESDAAVAANRRAQQRSAAASKAAPKTEAKRAGDTGKVAEEASDSESESSGSSKASRTASESDSGSESASES